jgi:16S rRNA (guanine527-N7)-methyltransferase
MPDKVTREVMAVPPAAVAVFADNLAAAEAYWRWLAGPGIERGLVGPREVARLWHRHLLNCAAMSALVPPRSVLIDIGSGAGLPGVVLAIVRPDVHVICVDPMQRRTTFLDEVVADLALSNVEVRRARAEELAKRVRGSAPLRADVVTARAVGSVDRLAGWAAPLLGRTGALVALKGSAVIDEVRSSWPTLRRAGYTGPTELFEIGLVPGASGSAAFQVDRIAGWTADSAGPAEAAFSLSAGDVGIGQQQPLATVLRILRSPG